MTLGGRWFIIVYNSNCKQDINVRSIIRMNTKSRELRFLTTTALFAALLCVTAPFSISIGPIPISLATFTVYVAALVCGWKGGCLAVAAYLVLGAVGLPVFSGFMGGFERLVGPTGGYLIGYIPCAITVGLFSDMAKKHRVLWDIVGMILGTVLLYTLGTAWFMFVSGNTLSYSLAACVLPFIAGDSIKIAAATLVAEVVRSRVIPAVTKHKSY